jgi:hypothetical protein
MRLLALPLVLANAALMGASVAASAQSPNSYPWCWRGGDGSNYSSCYYKSKEQCLTTISGIGAYCFENPEYQPPASDKAMNERPATKR